MTKIFALLAVFLILTGAVLLAIPREDPAPGGRGIASDAIAAVPSVAMRAREIAEQVNAPLSILFGIISLVYSRRNYHINRDRAEAVKLGKSA